MSTPPERPPPLVRLGRFLGLIGHGPRPGFPPSPRIEPDLSWTGEARRPDPRWTGEAQPEGGATKLGRFLGLTEGDEPDPRPDVAALRAEVDALRGDVRRLERRLRQVEREV